MFRRLFGESKSKDNENIKTINELKETENILNKKLDLFDQQINDYQNKAKQCLNKTNPNKLEAMKFLKKKKEFEQEKEKLFNIKENIQLINQQLQSAHFNQQIQNTFNIGQKHLNKINKTISIHQIEDIMENISQNIELSSEINHILSTPIQINDSFDISIENELNELNQEIIKDNLTKINLPDAYSDKIKINDTEQQLEELKRLTTG